MVLCIRTGRSRFFSQFNFFNIRQKSIALTFNCKENTDPVCVCVGGCLYVNLVEQLVFGKVVFQVSIEKSITAFMM